MASGYLNAKSSLPTKLESWHKICYNFFMKHLPMFDAGHKTFWGFGLMSLHYSRKGTMGPRSLEPFFSGYRKCRYLQVPTEWYLRVSGYESGTKVSSYQVLSCSELASGLPRPRPRQRRWRAAPRCSRLPPRCRIAARTAGHRSLAGLSAPAIMVSDLFGVC